MATIRNPRKKFNFRITFLEDFTFPTFAAQQVTTPDSEVEAVEHGYGNTVLKTAGLVKPGTLKVDRIISMTPADSQRFLRWQMQAQNSVNQTSGSPEFYKKVAKVEEYAYFGTNNPEVVDTFYCIGVWPQKINGKEYDRTASENIVESIEFAVDYLTPDLPVNV